MSPPLLEWQGFSPNDDNVLEGWYTTPRPSSAPPELPSSPSKHDTHARAAIDTDDLEDDIFDFPFVSVPDDEVPVTPRKNAPVDTPLQTPIAQPTPRTAAAQTPVFASVPAPPFPSLDEEELDDRDGLDPYSSPHVGPKSVRVARARAEGQRKRRETVQVDREALRELRRTKAQRDQERKRKTKEQEERDRRDALHLVAFSMLATLKEAGFTLREFLLLILDPAMRDNDLGKQRYTELYHGGDFIETVLRYWTTGGSAGSSSTVVMRAERWMTTHVAAVAAQEAAAITQGGLLQVAASGMTKERVLGFDADILYPHFESLAPVTLEICTSFATSRRQLKVQATPSQQRRQTIITYALSNLLRQHSRANSLVANYYGLYLYATGAQRQTISVLSHAGFTCSYSTIVKKLDRSYDTAAAVDVGGQDVDVNANAVPDNAESATRDAAASTSPDIAAAEVSRDAPTVPVTGSSQGLGILPALSRSCIEDAQRLAKTKEYEAAYDNVNVSGNVAQQSVTRIDTLQNMTAATAVDLAPSSENLEALSLESAERSFLAAGPLEEDDIMFTPDEARIWIELNISTVEHAILEYGEGQFSHFERQVDAADPRDELQLELRRTSIYPLQTMDIDEASITGNIDVVDAIHVQLAVDLESPDEQLARIIYGDQLTVSRIHNVVGARAGHEGGAESWRWAKPIPALFHTDMTAVTCVLTAHWGKPETGARNPGSLFFHNNVLHRKPIVLSSLPPYHVCRELLNVSMNARILHCLLKVTGQPDLVSCARSILTFAELHTHARAVYNEYASVAIVVELRAERRKGGRGDKIFENGTLFLRDTVGLRTFARAVKSGRSGHIFLALRWLAMMFKGGGHPKYAREMLYLIHHLFRVWPKKLRDLILRNWLVNPTGTKDGWVALDHMQEHLNFWIKKVYAAHGSNASPEWLAMISPCIDVLRKVANRVHASLGSYQGRKHTSPDLTRDIRSLMASLEEHKVYERGANRRGVKEAEIDAIPDLWGLGWQQMTDGLHATLTEYNAGFTTLQARARVKPLEDYVPSAPDASAASQMGGGQRSGADTAVAPVSDAMATDSARPTQDRRGTVAVDAGDRSEHEDVIMDDDAAREDEENMASGSSESSDDIDGVDGVNEPEERDTEIREAEDVALDWDSVWEDYDSELDDR